MSGALAALGPSGGAEQTPCAGAREASRGARGGSYYKRAFQVRKKKCVPANASPNFDGAKRVGTDPVRVAWSVRCTSCLYQKVYLLLAFAQKILRPTHTG